jgi:hypothetical protein
MALRKVLGTAEPILCLWLWAAENAPDGDLGEMTSDSIEEASGWHGKRGKAVMAMIEVGYIDVIPDGGMRLHNWVERAGRGVSSLIRTRERQRELMRNRRANVSANGADNNSETLSLSLDLGTSGSSSLSASDPDPERAHSNVNAKSADDWLSYFRQKYWEAKGRQYGQGSADAKALGNFGDLLGSLPLDQRVADWLDRERIVTEFLTRSDARTVGAGWPFCFFTTDFRGLAMPPERRPAVRATAGARDPSVGFHDVATSDHSKTGDIAL